MHTHITPPCEARLGSNCAEKPFLFHRIDELFAMEAECEKQVAADPGNSFVKEAWVECLGKDAVGKCIYDEREPEVIKIGVTDASLGEVAEQHPLQ